MRRDRRRRLLPRRRSVCRRQDTLPRPDRRLSCSCLGTRLPPRLQHPVCNCRDKPRHPPPRLSCKHRGRRWRQTILFWRRDLKGSVSCFRWYACACRDESSLSLTRWCCERARRECRNEVDDGETHCGLKGERAQGDRYNEIEESVSEMMGRECTTSAYEWQGQKFNLALGNEANRLPSWCLGVVQLIMQGGLDSLECRSSCLSCVGAPAVTSQLRRMMLADADSKKQQGVLAGLLAVV